MIAGSALLTLALAGPSLAGSEVFDGRRATLELILTQRVEDEPVLVGVRGARPETWRERVQDVRPDLPLTFVALADDQALPVSMALALRGARARCAVSLEAQPDGRWDLARWGSCGDGSVVLAEGERLLTGTALREEAVALAAGLEAPVAVAVLGEAPARAVAALLAGAPGLVPLQLAPQPDPRAVMPRALFAAGAACGLLVRPAPQGAWRVEPAGACGPVPSAAERVARAVAGDLRTAEDLADALALRVVDTDGPPDRGPDWSLQDGDGFVLTSLHMALQLGDEGAVERLERERRSRAGPALTLALTGGALQFVGGVQMLVGFDTAHSAGDYTERTDGLQLGWTGVVMTGAGALVASAAPLLRHGAAERRRRPDRFYSREEAEARVAAYDRELARALGVDEPQDEPGGEP